MTTTDSPVLTDREYDRNLGGTDSGWWKPSDPRDIVMRWHDDTHSGAFQFCDEQPCHAIVHAELP